MKKYSIGQMAKKLGLSVKTLQRWDKTGVLHAHRTPTNQRMYTDDQYRKIMGLHQPKSQRLVVAYARVSSRSQRDDLKNQIKFIQTFANAKGIILNKMITDVGSGLNYNRRNWNKLLRLVMKHQVETIFITYKDRFIRFGFSWFDRFCNDNDAKIVVLNDKETSPIKEVAHDVLRIIRAFSYRLHGLRKYEDKIKNDKVIRKEEQQ